MTGIMAAYFRNDGWKEDIVLKEEMAKYVKQGFQRREMLDFLKRDFAQYAWSLRTVDRRLRHFDIQYNSLRGRRKKGRGRGKGEREKGEREKGRERLL